MPTIPCPDYLFDCDCSNSPVRNFSAEAVDVAAYFGTYNQPPGGPLGPFVSTGCQAICESTVSQEAADECAMDQAFLCSAPPGVPVYRGGTQTCTVDCDDGLSFSWTEPITGGLDGVLPGGIPTFPIGPDTPGGGGGVAQRPTFATIITSPEKMALCLGELIFIPIQLTNSDLIGSYELGMLNYKRWTVTKGDIPPGLTFNQHGQFTGTPTQTGTYFFTVELDHIGYVRVSPEIFPFHLHAKKDFQFRIIEFLTDQVLPDAILGDPYTTTLEAVGTLNGEQWSVVPGWELPPGLTITPVFGVISGTPTAEGTFNFLINLIDEAGGPLGHTCQKFYQITVTT